jgi:hypothetical protein
VQKKIDQYDRMKPGHKPKNVPARYGSPSYPKVGAAVGGKSVTKGRGAGATVTVDRKFDEIDRSSVRAHKTGSNRTDKYTGPGRTKGNPTGTDDGSTGGGYNL